jgi:hypothetical protein
MLSAIHSPACFLPTTQAPSRERGPCPDEGRRATDKTTPAHGSDPTTLRLGDLRSDDDSFCTRRALPTHPVLR